jgi:pimeloyl-ACP methyl ester carboxylesterase
VKYRTNKDKVVIVSHSMGGIVTRRYLQIFGGENVEKAILVTSPNHGIDDKIRDYCAVIGPEVSCNELDKDSSFMADLNTAPISKVPIYNIVGVGCNMGAETGDGFIKNSSQYLDSATNYYFTGKCNEPNFEFFHEYIVFPDKYPAVYNKIYEILKNSN